MSAPLIVLSGPPGSGKTTVGALLAKEFTRSAHVRGDHFYRYIVGDWRDPSTREAHEQNQAVVDISTQAACGYAQAGYTTILDGIFGPWFLERMQATIGPTETHYVVLRANLATSLDRAVDRSDTPTTEQMVRTIHGQFSQLAELESHVIDTTIPTPPEVRAAVLGRVTNGSVRLLQS